MTLSRFSLGLILIAVFVSCNKENPDSGNGTGYLHGAYITNEGAFGNSNGSVSYFDKDSSLMHNHIFESVNGRPLGDVVQSVGIAGGKGFIVVNNSQKVEVVDLKSFTSIGTITGLESPRYFLAVNEKKGYLSDGNLAGRVYVIDIESLKITDTIPVGYGPEKMVIYGNKLLVANSGGWGSDSTLTVIDTDKDKVTATWQVGMDPVDLVLDKNNQLWVLCVGKVVWNPDYTIGEETPSSLVVIDPSTGKRKQSFDIGSVGDFYWPLHMGINKSKDIIYYLESSGIHAMGIHSGSTPAAPLVPGYLYGFGVDASTDLIYALKAPSFTVSGWVLRYHANGTRLDSLEVGIGPSQITFN